MVSHEISWINGEAGRFVEIRNENWETVARIADLNGSDMLTWDELQAATDADGNLYPEISSAWDAVKAFFPDVASIVAEPVLHSEG